MLVWRLTFTRKDGSKGTEDFYGDTLGLAEETMAGMIERGIQASLNLAFVED
jgi:hypothetical protein